MTGADANIRSAMSREVGRLSGRLARALPESDALPGPGPALEPGAAEVLR